MKRVILCSSLLFSLLAIPSRASSEDPTPPIVNLPLPRENLERSKRMRIKNIKRLLELMEQCKDYSELKESGIYLEKAFNAIYRQPSFLLSR